MHLHVFTPFKTDLILLMRIFLCLLIYKIQINVQLNNQMNLFG